MNINILAIAVFILLHAAYFAFVVKESDNLRNDNDLEREAATFDFFKP